MALWELLPNEMKTEEYLLTRLRHIAEENLKAINDQAYKDAMKNGQTQNFFSIVGPTLPAAPAAETGGKKGHKGKSKGQVTKKGKGKSKGKGNTKGKTKGAGDYQTRNNNKGKGQGKAWQSTQHKGYTGKGKSNGKGYRNYNTGGSTRESSWSSRTSSQASRPTHTRQQWRYPQMGRYYPVGWDTRTRYTPKNERADNTN